MRDRKIEIRSRDYWFKIIDMLQQNWALIDESNDGVIVYFFGDTGGVFDRMTFESVSDAELGLVRNGFSRYSADKEAKKFIVLPELPLWESTHPNGPIYSSGRYWR